LGSLNVIIRVRIYTIARFIRRFLLQVPRTPPGDLVVIDLLFEW
jgi:hypothetical protein